MPTADAAFSYRVYAEPDGDHLPWPAAPARGGYPHPTGKPDGFQAPVYRDNRQADRASYVEGHWLAQAR